MTCYMLLPTFFFQHPYIWPLVDLDLWTEQSLVISVQTYEKRGSLKDHIYGVGILPHCFFLLI